MWNGSSGVYPISTISCPKQLDVVEYCTKKTHAKKYQLEMSAKWRHKLELAWVMKQKANIPRSRTKITVFLFFFGEEKNKKLLSSEMSSHEIFSKVAKGHSILNMCSGKFWNHPPVQPKYSWYSLNATHTSMAAYSTFTFGKIAQKILPIIKEKQRPPKCPSHLGSC